MVLNQLTFGDKTNSPDATKLPVLLAVALLKDSRGNIDINLPISGSLDDPEFSVGGIVVRVVLNLVVKAVTSPFSLLASAFGGGEELSYVEFAPGSAALTEDSQQRIDTLIKALTDRPGLKMDLSGRADPKTDMEGLRQAWIESKIRAAKAAAVAPRGKKLTRPASTCRPPSAQVPGRGLRRYRHQGQAQEPDRHRQVHTGCADGGNAAQRGAGGRRAAAPAGRRARPGRL